MLKEMGYIRDRRLHLQFKNHDTPRDAIGSEIKVA
jgi:hypothetical protein